MSMIPRGDFVIVKISTVDTVKGIAMPECSIQGQEFHVVAFGPKVENLEVGDKIMMTGQLGVDYSFIPNNDKHLIIREANIVLVFKE